MLAGVQCLGNVIASTTASILYTTVSPGAALAFAAAALLIALLVISAQPQPTAR